MTDGCGERVTSAFFAELRLLGPSFWTAAVQSDVRWLLRFTELCVAETNENRIYFY